MTAFIMIFIDVDGWSQDEMPHAVIGTITTAICFFHPILAIFRPNLGDPKRKYFNNGHAFGGILAQILSRKNPISFILGTIVTVNYSRFIFVVVTIFLAVNMDKAELPAWLFFVLAGFVVSLIAFHLYFTFLSYKAESHPSYSNRNLDAPVCCNWL